MNSNLMLTLNMANSALETFQNALRLHQNECEKTTLNDQEKLRLENKNLTDEIQRLKRQYSVLKEAYDELERENLEKTQQLKKTTEIPRSIKYQETVRGNQRKALHGMDCECCKNWYIDDEDKQEHQNKVSRHRVQYVPPSTPEGYWEVGFPSPVKN